jgi:sulfonate transport system ATP-binding protein
MPANDVAIRLADVAVTLSGVRVLADIALEIRHGACVALLGPSGCGKTTLLRVISQGVAFSGEQHIAGRVGVVYQDLKLLPWLTVLDNVTLGLPGDSRADTAAAQLLETMGLSGKLAVYPYLLSGGQRVAIARALLGGAEILLLDEPFSALDFVARGRLLALTQELQRANELTLIVVTHDINDALALADRLVVLRDGRIVGDLPNPRNGAEGVQAIRAAVLELCGG